MRAAETATARGSLKWIRRAVNEHTATLDSTIVAACGLAHGTSIRWVSPLANDEYAEYGDQDFLNRLGIALQNRALADFWPNRGPQWDALARTEAGEFLLVEAKANVPEIVSPGTSASETSKRRIVQSLAETKAFLRVEASIPWSGRLYQYANRLAHLYWLRELNRVPAYLVFVYFVGDKDVDGPDSVAEWKAALTVAKKVLGLSERNPLSKYIGEVFIDVRTLSDET